MLWWTDDHLSVVVEEVDLFEMCKQGENRKREEGWIDKRKER